MRGIRGGGLIEEIKERGGDLRIGERLEGIVEKLREVGGSILANLGKAKSMLEEFVDNIGFGGGTDDDDDDDDDEDDEDGDYSVQKLRERLEASKGKGGEGGGTKWRDRLKRSSAGTM